MSVKNIKNVTISADLSTGSDFFRDLGVRFMPTDAVIRQISYSGPNATEAGVFMVWCSLINDFIGTFSVNNYGITVQPKIQLHFTSPIQSSAQFKIFTITAGGAVAPFTGLVGDFTISIDFIENK